MTTITRPQAIVSTDGRGKAHRLKEGALFGTLVCGRVWLPASVESKPLGDVPDAERCSGCWDAIATVTAWLPALRGGRRWEITRWKSSPRKRTPDRTAVNLYARTGSHIGYIAEYDNGWGINVARGNSFKSMPGVFGTGERAAAALIKALANR